jgi:hypothetical protein
VRNDERQDEVDLQIIYDIKIDKEVKKAKIAKPIREIEEEKYPHNSVD